jgi:hypothetical protein
MLGAMDFGIADHRQPSGAQTVDSDMVEITRDALGALPRGTWSTLTIAIPDKCEIRTRQAFRDR